MELDSLRSLWQELIDSFYYMIDSIQGKLSLDSYLDILGQYTDSLILASAQEGLSYLSGTCTIRADEAGKALLFSVELFFLGTGSQPVQKSAERALPNKKFTREAVRKVQASPLRFSIDPPKRK